MQLFALLALSIIGGSARTLSGNVNKKTLEQRDDGAAFKLYDTEGCPNVTPKSVLKPPNDASFGCIDLPKDPGNETSTLGGQIVFGGPDWQAGFYDAPGCPADKKHVAYQSEDASCQYLYNGYTYTDVCLWSIWSGQAGGETHEGSIFIAPKDETAPGGWPDEKCDHTSGGVPPT